MALSSQAICARALLKLNANTCETSQDFALALSFYPELRHSLYSGHAWNFPEAEFASPPFFDTTLIASLAAVLAPKLGASALRTQFLCDLFMIELRRAKQANQDITLSHTGVAS